MTDLFELLGNERRRRAIGYLALFDPDATVSVRHLATGITAVERNMRPSEFPAQTVESAYNSLIQNHLPKMADAGLCEYDVPSKTILVLPRLHEAAELIARGKH